MTMKLNYLSGFFLSLITLTGCTSEPTPDPKPKELYHFYFILTPTNPDRAKLAKQTILNAKTDGSDGEKTQVIFPAHNYTVIEICDRNTPDFMTSKISIQDVNNLDSVTQKAEISIETIVKGTRSCKATAPSLVEVTKNINQAALNSQNKKMIIFLQAPWSRTEITDSNLKDLSAAIDRLAATGKVERLVLTNLNPDGADRLTKSFQGLKNKVVAANDDISQTVEHLKNIRKNYLDSENK
jgi:hypothetical protein